MAQKYTRDRLATMPQEPANRFSRIVELYPDRVDAFIAHCGQKSDRYKTLGLNMCYAAFNAWHSEMRALFVRRAAEFFECSAQDILTEKAWPLFTAKVKEGNSRKGSRGSRWCRLETMPEDPNERLSTIVVKNGASIVSMFVSQAKALECGSLKIKRALPRYVDNLLYGRFDLFQKAFPPVLRDFVCKFFGYEAFEECFTPMRLDHLSRQTDKFAFPAHVLRKIQRLGDCVTQLKTMGVTIKADDLGLFLEMQGATHTSDYAIITTHGELRRRKLITEQASAGNEFSLSELEGNRGMSLVNQE